MSAPALVAASDARPPGAWAALWRHREFLRALVARNLKVKYQRSALGFLWTLVNPLATVGVLLLVFSHVVRVPVRPYWAFLLSGYFVWNFVQSVLAQATGIFAEHAALRRSAAFPSEVLVFGAAGSRLVEFLAELAIATALLVGFHHRGVPAAFLLLPVLVALLVLLVLGLVLPLTVLAVHYRDVQHVLPVVLLVLFYASPVIYPAHLVPPAMQGPYHANPVALLLGCFHAVLFAGRVPDAPLLAGAASAALLVFVLGHAWFRRHAPRFAEIV